MVFVKPIQQRVHGRVASSSLGSRHSFLKDLHLLSDPLGGNGQTFVRLFAPFVWSFTFPSLLLSFPMLQVTGPRGKVRLRSPLAFRFERLLLKEADYYDPILVGPRHLFSPDDAIMATRMRHSTDAAGRTSAALAAPGQDLSRAAFEACPSRVS